MVGSLGLGRGSRRGGSGPREILRPAAYPSVFYSHEPTPMDDEIFDEYRRRLFSVSHDSNYPLGSRIDFRENYPNFRKDYRIIKPNMIVNDGFRLDNLMIIILILMILVLSMYT